MQRIQVTLTIVLLLCFGIINAQPQIEEQDTAIKRGILLFEQGDFERSIDVFEQRLKKAIKEGNKKVQKIAYNNLGNNYTNTGKTVEALEAYQHCITIAEELKDKKSVARARINMGGMYSDMKDFKKAIKEFNEGEAIAISINDSASVADCANNRGIIFEQEKKYEDALREYDKALRLYIAMNKEERMSITYSNLGIVYKFLKDYDKSIDCYNKSMALSRKLGLKFMEAVNLINTGNVYEMKGDYKNAIALNEQGLAIGKELNAQELIMEATGNLAIDHGKAGDYHAGFDLYKDYIAIKDSFINVERSKQLAEIQTRYETEKKEKKILTLQKSRILMMSIIGGMVFVIVIAFLLYNRQQIKQKQRREKEVAEAEYHERMRIAKDVHDDLGAGLSKISLMAAVAQKKANNNTVEKDIQRISVMSHELVDSMRDLIWVLNPENTTLEQLVWRMREYCGDYMDGLPVNVTLHFPAEVPELRILREGQRNIFLTVKETINNSIKHAAADRIDVRLAITDSILNISISDNGVGFDTAQIRSGGNGLRNMKQRITSIGGSYTVVSQPGNGTTTTVTIPLQQLSATKNTTLV